MPFMESLPLCRGSTLETSPPISSPTITSAKDNQIEVQSTGVQVLDNIIRILQDEGIMATPYSFQPFNQRFNDECAGVFCNVTFEVLNAPCGETFTDNNNIKII